MSGRFFSGVFVAGLVLLLTYKPEKKLDLSPSNYYFSIFLLMILGLTAERPPILIHENQLGSANDQFGIVNEKYYYYGATGWINYHKHNTTLTMGIQGREAHNTGISPVTQNIIGFFGYYAGSDIYIIDEYALADPLRARLPVDIPNRVGHYLRAMPIGYQETIANEFMKNEIANPYLKLYYDKLMILTRDNLFSSNRLKEIIYFNLGRYDNLIKLYLESINTK